MTMRRGVIVLFGMAVLAGVVYAAIRGAGWLDTEAAGVPSACAETVALTPLERPGAPWVKHRHRLAASGSYEGLYQGYVIRNERSGRSFEWAYRRTPSGDTEFYVPTRYAQAVNRQWKRDPWVFCGARRDPTADTPGHQAVEHGFTTSAIVRPASAHGGATATITVSVVSDRTVSLPVYIEVRDPTDARIMQHWAGDQMLPAGERRDITVVWQISPAAPPGIYIVRAGIFGDDNRTLLHWNNGAGGITVLPSSAGP